MKHIIEVLKRNKWKLALIYTYIFVGQLIFLMEPYFLGKAIDGLLNKEYLFLGILLGSFILENLFMYKRMVYDIRVYTQMYNDIVMNYLQRDEKSKSSEKIARTEMLHSVIGFIEHELHYYISAIMTIIGSLYFVFIQHIPTGIVMLACTPLTVMIAFKFYKKIGQSTKVCNSHYEQKFDTMNTGDEGLIDNFFKRRRRLVISANTIHAKNWFSLNVTKSILLVGAVVVFTHDSVGLSHGQAISIYTYINQFLNSLMALPIGLETYTRISDVIRRINQD
jgi:hypothetical protein